MKLFTLYGIYLIFISSALTLIGGEESPAVKSIDKRNIRLAQRFLDPDHFQLAEEKGLYPDGSPMPAGTPFYEAYGASAFEAWKRAVDYVDNESPLRFPVPQDILDIHRLVLHPETSTFGAFWMDRVSKMTNEHRKARARSLIETQQWEKLEGFLGLSKPIGIWRDGVALAGSLRAPGDKATQPAFIDKETLGRFLLNADLVVRQITSQDGVHFKIKYSFKAIQDESMEQMVQQLFIEMREGLARIPPPNGSPHLDTFYLQSVNRIMARFYKRLVSHHPTWDGSGRTSKLVRDWIYQYLKLPPPAYTPWNDLLLSESELADAFFVGQKSTNTHHYNQKVTSQYSMGSCISGFTAFAFSKGAER